jgi:hypothetical protein
MPWANFDDKFPRHPKVRRLSDAAFRLHVSGICHSAEWKLDGRIPADEIPDLVPRFKPAHLAELANHGIWIDGGDYYDIHDYLQWNRSRQQIEDAHENARKRQKKWRDEHRNDDGTYRD